MKTNKLVLSLLLGILTSSNLAMANQHTAIRACSPNHCRNISAHLAEMCLINSTIIGLTVGEYDTRGGSAVTRDDSGFCVCHCEVNTDGQDAEATQGSRD